MKKGISSSTETMILPLKNRGYHTQEAGSDSLAPSDRGFIMGLENKMLETAQNWVLNRDHLREEHPDLGMPLLIYGPSGCGKSHWVYGLFQCWKELFPGKKAVYHLGTDFSRQYTESLATRTVETFRRRVRSVPLWIIDPIDELRGHTAAQEEFLYLLDYSIRAGNLVILTSSRFPGECPFSFPGLTDRLIGGWTIPVQIPTSETRRIMLEEIAHHFRITFHSSALDYLAKTLVLPYSGLYGLISQLVLSWNGRPQDETAIRRFLKQRSELVQPSLTEIARQTAKYYNIRQTDLKGKTRKSEIVRARAMSIYLARELTGYSLKEIGRFFGNRDHKTIAHHCEEMEQKVSTDPHLGASANQIKEMIARRPKK